MKRKLDFVTNSSSSSFIFTDKELTIRDAAIDMIELIVHEYKTDLYYYDGKVRIDYYIQPTSLGSLLNKIYQPNISDLTLVPEDKFFSSIDPSLAARVQKLAGDYIDEKLNNFVAERGFKSIESAVTYADDLNPELAASGARAKAVSSEVYTIMRIYLNNVINNTLPIPRSLSVIDANIPPMTWE